MQSLQQDAAPQSGSGEQTVEPLTCLSRICQTAAPPSHMLSLGFQLSSAIAQLGSFLAVRGETRYEHYFAQAITLSCLQPASANISGFEKTLMLFVMYDRRRPQLPRLSAISDLAVNEAPSIHFIQLLREQAGFQVAYECVRQIDRYGAMSRSTRKMERIILLARELAGHHLLAASSAIEDHYLRLACS